MTGIFLSLSDAVASLSALAQESRLAVFRLLIRAGPEGLPAGQIAREIGVTPSSLSSHLTILSHAGLIGSRREGRSIIYAADHAQMGELLRFLVADCCDGRPEICASLTEIAQARCAAA